MKKFDYSRPENLYSAAARLNGTGKARALAGGTDLLGTLKERILPVYPDELVSLKGLSLSYIKEENAALRIGAMTTLAELEASDVIKKYPVLREAARQVAAPQIRNMATVGGNICQEPRCWYYRYPDNKFYCMRKGGQLCNALTGNNTYHSVFGAAKVCDTACQRTCPNGTEISAYMEQLRKGDIKGAAEILFRVNPIAAVTGRVCPHTCQGECSRHLFDQAVSIRDVERYLGDYILDHAGEFYRAPGKEAGKRAALIGAGPAGLTAAYFLRSRGVSVTVIDNNSEIGGMLYYGIPAYRLPKSILKRLQEALEGMGVEFKMNTAVGTPANAGIDTGAGINTKTGTDNKIGDNLTFDEIVRNYDAVMVGTGAWLSQGLECTGGNAEGVTGGIDFLYQVALHQQFHPGKNVVVAGGGNTAMDACRTAKRMGAETVTVVYRRTQAEMPADPEEIAEAEEEGVVFKFLAAPLEIVRGADDHIRQVVLQKMELGEPDQSGRRRPIPIRGATETIEADALIAAIGQNIDAGGFPGLTLGRKNEIITEASSCMTNLDKVFAAGDAASGPKTAVEAIAGARKAAAAVAAYLNVCAGESKTCPDGIQAYRALDFDPASLGHSDAGKTPVIPVADRTLYGEDMTEQAAERQIEKIFAEAKRCFNCGCVAVSPSDIAPALIALDAAIVTTERTVPAAEFFDVGVESSTILQKDELVKEIVISSEKAGSCQSYRKFRTRKSIDFPIAGLASNIEIKDGRITAAKLVFSGVAPVPYEFKNVEAFLCGRIPDAETADAAGRIALEGVKPLAENLFKAQLIKTYIRRAVLDAGKNS
jgi:NADPH-dependent glutamate synthase beta subunit-like oxidoreductase/CO/xanthine dehydrogenase FAD-binding subunit